MGSIPRTSGVYRLTCIPTGKVYVGSAINLAKRWHEHRKTLVETRHHNIHLQNAWNKYGEDAFEFVVIELVLSPFLTAREQYWMNHYRSHDRNRGFNIAPTAGSSLGIKRSEASREKMRNRIVGSDTREKIGLLRRGKTQHPNSQRAIDDARADYWEVTDPNGRKQIVQNLTKFCRDNNLSFSVMKTIAHGYPDGRGYIQTRHRGWACRKVDRP